MSDTVIDRMKADIKADADVLKIKRRLVRILDKLPNDDARRRVLAGVSALYGNAGENGFERRDASA